MDDKLMSDTLTKQAVMRQLATDQKPSVRSAVARNRFITPDVIDILSKDSSNSVLGALAENTAVSVDVLRELAKVKSSVVADGLIANNNTPSDVLHLAFKATTSRYVHQDIIKHPNVSKETLEAIAAKYKNKTQYNYWGGSTNLNYISLAAKNAMKKGGGSSSLRDQATKGATYKRAALAADPNLPNDIVELLAKDKSMSVRSALAENIRPIPSAAPGVPVHLAYPEPKSMEDKQLLGHIPPSAPDKPLTAEDVWRDLAKSYNPTDARLSAALHTPSTCLDVLQHLATDPNEEVVLGLFKDRNTPLPVLEILATHKSKEVRRKTAVEQYCTPELLQKLARDPEWEVREAAVKNPRFGKAPEPPEVAKEDGFPNQW